MEILQKYIGIIGIATLIAIALSLSSNIKLIKWRLILSCLAGQFLVVFLFLHTEIGKLVILETNNILIKVLDYSYNGVEFVFGPLYSSFGQNYPFIFIALFPIVFFCSLFSLLYHLGVMQVLVRFFSRILSKLLSLSAVEAVFSVCKIFLDLIQSAATVMPYLKNLTKSEMFLLITLGLATASGPMFLPYYKLGANLSYVLAASVTSILASIALAKIIYPETESPTQIVNSEVSIARPKTRNIFDAIATGALEGGTIVLYIAVILVAFVAFIYLLDGAIGLITFHHYTLTGIFKWIFMPFAYLIGIPINDLQTFSQLFSEKTFFNEVIAFSHLKNYQYSDKTYMMLCFGLPSFANFASIPTVIGGLEALVPERRDDIVKMCFKALITAIMANLMCAAVAGLMY